MTQSIEITAGAGLIFDYISDLGNDPTWRPEVSGMVKKKADSKVGDLTIEHITIYRFFHFITPVFTKILQRPTLFIAETTPEHSSWVECVRSLEELDNGTCRLTVKLSFSLDNIKQIFPVIPPGFIVEMWYLPRIKNYLKKLKKLLEEKATEKTELPDMKE